MATDIVKSVLVKGGLAVLGIFLFLGSMSLIDGGWDRLGAVFFLLALVIGLGLKSKAF